MQAEPDPRRAALLELSERIGHEFKDLDLLERALCHSSTGNEGKANYERLEFLGDAILGFLVADHLFRQNPEIPEGALTDRRARIVSRKPLAGVAADLRLITYLDAGRGLREEDLTSERIHADLVEAVCGAIYLDGGIRAARKFIRRHLLAARLDPSEQGSSPRDPKSRLLHFAQMHDLGQPGYHLVDAEGPDHRRMFTLTVAIADEHLGTGTARSKQAAEMKAAAQTLRILQKRLADAGAGDRDPSG